MSESVALRSFDDFLGSRAQVLALRRAIAAGRLPHSLLLTGPRGAGKYTLAILLAMALDCERQPRSADAEAGGEVAGFCGVCSNCVRIAASLDLQTRVDEAIAAREELRETDKKETRILVQTHPAVLVIPPDPPQLLIKLGQVRTLIAGIYRTPTEAQRSVAIFTAATFMKEAANSLLKVLEEPPPHAHIILIAEHTGELLPTIRSRCALVRLGAMETDELDRLLAERRPEWKPAQRQLVARLAQGAPGSALHFDLEGYLTARTDAMILLRSALTEPDHSDLFRMTEGYRAGADGQAKTMAMLGALAGLLEDLMYLGAGLPEGVRNVDLARELEKLAQSVDFRWIEQAVRAMDHVYSGMRRNLLRSLSLDAMAETMSSAR